VNIHKVLLIVLCYWPTVTRREYSWSLLCLC